jgi:hypothetical protein
MCLELVAIPDEAGLVSADALSKVSGLTVTKSHHPCAGSLHFSRGGGCACSLLSDNADWNNPTWDLDPQVLDGLAKAVTLLGERVSGFVFQAIWMGDEPETTDRVRLEQLLRDIRANAVRNKHVYRIGRAGQQ